MLFIDKPVYQYLLQLEVGVCAYGAGHPAQGLAAFNALLRQSDLPAEVAVSARRGQTAAYQALFPEPPQLAEAAPNRLVVITAFHNAGPYLAQCLASMQAQYYCNFEVLLLDDASTDGATAAVPTHYPRFRLLRSPHRRDLAYHLPRLINQYCQPNDIVATTGWPLPVS